MTLPLNEIQKKTDELELSSSLSSFKVAFLCNVTNQHIVIFLRYFLACEGLRLDESRSGYDDALGQLLDENSILIDKPEIVIINQHERILMPALTTSMIRMSPSQVQDETGRWKEHLKLLIEATRRQTNASIILHTLDPIVEPTLGILDATIDSGQTALCAELNGWLTNMVRNLEGCYLLDMNRICNRLGWDNYFDPRYWQFGKSPYTIAASEEIANYYMAFIRTITGKQRKCLVLDCDNTLWGGVVGEEGLYGIALGKSHQGEAFLNFQNCILNLHHRGVLLALCSKNNESDVLEVLENHPEMLLRAEHFATTRINWHDKPCNLKEIARELNIGLDSLVFVDDSAFEIAMVQQMLPEVQTIHLEGEPYGFADKLFRFRLFDSLIYSNEDRLRNSMYRAEAERTKASQGFDITGKDEYFRYLEMDITISNIDEFSIARSAQMTQRTHQFNLTTRRYTEGEMTSFLSNGRILCLSLKDRFGEMGIVGLAMLRFDDTATRIDNFMLSCRVIGRGVEGVLLFACVQAARLMNANTLIGQYIPTPKNSPAANFYPEYGFDKSSKENYSLSPLSQVSFKKYFNKITFPADL